MPQHSTSFLEEFLQVVAQRYLYMDVCYNGASNDSNMEITWISINRRMNNKLWYKQVKRNPTQLKMKELEPQVSILINLKNIMQKEKKLYNDIYSMMHLCEAIILQNNGI